MDYCQSKKIDVGRAYTAATIRLTSCRAPLQWEPAREKEDVQ